MKALLMLAQLLLHPLPQRFQITSIQRSDGLPVSTEAHLIPECLNIPKGPTQTGAAPWLAQTNVAPFPGVSYIPNAPLETQVPSTLR